MVSWRAADPGTITRQAHAYEDQLCHGAGRIKIGRGIVEVEGLRWGEVSIHERRAYERERDVVVGRRKKKKVGC